MVVLRTALSALAALTAISHAAPAGFISKEAATTASSFEVTNIAAHHPSNKHQDITFSFVVHDPNPLTNTTTLCSYEWAANGSYPQGGYVCIPRIDSTSPN